MLKKITKKTFSPRLLMATFAVFGLLTTFFLTKTNLKYIYAAGEPLTIGAPVTLSGTYTISAPQFIDTANSAYFLDPAATGNSLIVAGNVGIGTTGPGYKLDVNGTGNFATSLTVAGATGGVVPSGAVMYFNLSACPSGWTDKTSSWGGRYIVALPSGGTLAGTDGTALSNLEDRPVGQHTHTISDPGHSHSSNADKSVQSGGGLLGTQGAYYASQSFTINSATTGISIQNAGLVAMTNAPYVQLLVCQKN